MRIIPSPADEIGEPDMTPMIDVTFQLLIFFVLTLNFKRQEGKLEAFLPKKWGPTEKVTTDILEDIRVRLTRAADGTTQIQVADEILGTAAPGRIEVFHALAARLRDLHRQFVEAHVVIDGGPAVPFQHVISALDAAKAAGCPEIDFLVP